MSEPVIRLNHRSQVLLTAWALATGGREFSGLGEIEKEGNVINVVDVHLLGVGSNTFTEFSPERQNQLPADKRRKLWFHRHPVGDGKYGPHNWSGRDEQTATREPLGTDPKLVQWSVAIVLTPGGWVGRVDVHVPKSVTFHCPVEPNIVPQEIVDEAQTLLTPELGEYVRQLLAEYEARLPKYRHNGPYSQTEFYFDEGREGGTGTGFYCLECPDTELEFADQDAGEYGYVYADLCVCPRCQQVYADVNTVCDVIIPAQKRKRKSRPGWTSTWNKWFQRR